MKTFISNNKSSLTLIVKSLVVSFLAIGILSTLPVMAGYDENPAKSKSIAVGDPINARTQAYYFHVPMFNLGGVLPIKFGLTYQSVTNFNSHNRFLPAIPRLKRWGSEKVYAYRWGAGEGEILFENTEQNGSGTWNNGPYAEYQYGLQEISGAGNWFYMMDPSDQTVYIYEKDANDDNVTQISRLLYHIDRNGNRVTYTYDSWNYYPNITISDGYRDINITTDGLILKSVSNGTRTYSLTHNASNHVTGITNPLNHTVAYDYLDANSDCMSKQTLPKGNIPYSQTYRAADDCRVTTQTDAYNNLTTLTVTDDALTMINTVIETRPDGTDVVYEHSHKGASPISIKDAEGNKANFTINNNDQMTGITDSLGDTVSITYHAETGFISSFTNANGGVVSHTYSPQSQEFTNPSNGNTFTFIFYNRTRTDYPDGTHESIVYDSKGNITSFTNRNNETTSYTYNLQGLMLTITNNIGGVTTYTYNADGTKATSTDTDIGITVYGYDIFRRLNTIDNPGDGQITIVYDLMDKITSATDENGNTHQYRYNSNGSLIEIIDPTNNSIKYSYDLMDRINSITNRTNNTTTMAYNYRGQVISIADNSIETTFKYNSRAWLESTSRNGKTSTISYDTEGIITSATTATGHSFTQGSNNQGYIVSGTLPEGQSTNLSYDSMGHISSATDALNRKTQYTYNNNGRLIGVTLPDNSSTSYTLNSIGKLTNISDPNGKNWEFSYSSMGRVTSNSDPLNNKTSFLYNDRGWLKTTTYPDTGIKTSSYDNSGKLISSVHSDGTNLTFAYDANGNLITTNSLGLTRDNEERITTSTQNTKSFGVSYDADERVATATYDGALNVTYSYNDDNLLSQVKDNLGNTVDFTYNADSNPITITRSNGVNTSYSWNNNGRLASIKDGDFVDLQYGYDDAGQMTSTKGSLALNPAEFASKVEKSFTVNAASQTNSSGYTYDKRGRATTIPNHTLTWNSAEQLTKLDSISFTYNGLNEIISRTEDEVTTNYYHNHAIKSSPIVAEEKNGSYSRYYIYTPSGKLLYSIDPQNSNAVAFYHSDQIGSTVALTDKSGDTTDKYAYSPFGELLGHTGSSTQPYTYVGAFGVRQEGNLYQMRLRYYDPISAKFLSREPIWPNINNPALTNPYQYAVQSPTQYIDPSGLFIDPTAVDPDDSANEDSSNIVTAYGIASKINDTSSAVKYVTKLIRKTEDITDVAKNVSKVNNLTKATKNGMRIVQAGKGVVRVAGKVVGIVDAVVTVAEIGVRVYDMSDRARNSKAVGEDNNAKWYWSPCTWISNQFKHPLANMILADEIRAQKKSEEESMVFIKNKEKVKPEIEISKRKLGLSKKPWDQQPQQIFE